MSKSLLYVVTSPSTAKSFLSGYLADIKSRGWNVTLVCASDSDVRDFARREGVDYREVNFERNPAAAKDVVALVKLIRIMRTVSPEVAIYATPKASLLGAISSRLARIPVRVYEQWGLRLESVRGYRRILLSMLEWLTIRLSTVVVANSISLARRIESLRLARPNTIVTLGSGSSHGVNVDWFSRDNTSTAVDNGTEKFLADGGKFTVGFVGRLHPDKGVDTLIRALDECTSRGLAVRCILIGANEGALQPGGKLSEEIVYHAGKVPDTQPYYREMDLLVLMSKREGFPNVVLEAASMGVPAVVSDATGVVDSVVDGETGFVVPLGDSQALVEKMAHLILNPRRREAMGEAARTRAIRDFDSRRVRNLHIELFGDELERHRN